jgi:hypothetical protein
MYIQTWRTEKKPPCTTNIHLIKKIKCRREENIFWGGRGRHKERGNEGVYGRCILCPYTKIEE